MRATPAVRPILIRSPIRSGTRSSRPCPSKVILGCRKPGLYSNIPAVPRPKLPGGAYRPRWESIFTQRSDGQMAPGDTTVGRRSTALASKPHAPVNTLKASLLSFCGVIAVVSALAQPNSQFPVSTNVPEPTPTPQTSPLLTPETVSSPPTPAPMLSPIVPVRRRSRMAQCPCLCRRCLRPSFEDAKTLSEQLNVPIPAPSQFSEPLMKPGEWIFSPAILQPSPTPAPTLSPTPDPTQSHQ